MQVTDRVFAAGRSYLKIVVQRMMPNLHLPSARVGPLIRIDRAERQIDRKSFPYTKIAVERIGVFGHG